VICPAGPWPGNPPPALILSSPGLRRQHSDVDPIDHDDQLSSAVEPDPAMLTELRRLLPARIAEPSAKHGSASRRTTCPASRWIADRLEPIGQPVGDLQVLNGLVRGYWDLLA